MRLVFLKEVGNKIAAVWGSVVKKFWFTSIDFLRPRLLNNNTLDSHFDFSCREWPITAPHLSVHVLFYLFLTKQATLGRCLFLPLITSGFCAFIFSTKSPISSHSPTHCLSGIIFPKQRSIVVIALLIMPTIASAALIRLHRSSDLTSQCNAHSFFCFPLSKTLLVDDPSPMPGQHREKIESLPIRPVYASRHAP